MIVAIFFADQLRGIEDRLPRLGNQRVTHQTGDLHQRHVALFLDAVVGVKRRVEDQVEFLAALHAQPELGIVERRDELDRFAGGLGDVVRQRLVGLARGLGVEDRLHGEANVGRMPGARQQHRCADEHQQWQNPLWPTVLFDAPHGVFIAPVVCYVI